MACDYHYVTAGVSYQEPQEVKCNDSDWRFVWTALFSIKLDRVIFPHFHGRTWKKVVMNFVQNITTCLLCFMFSCWQSVVF